MNKKISIIIPVYNGEKFLKKCLDSVLKQTYSNYEIIIVNDGSTDKTSDILKKYQKIKKITVFNQENQGVSIARNNGIDRATGDYIMFVDVDDQIREDALEILNRTLYEKNVDIIRFNGYIQSKKKEYKEIEFPVANYACYKSNEDIDKILNIIVSNNAINCYTPLLIIRNDGIIKFNNNLKYLEDKAFYLENFIQKNKKILFVNEKLYYYNYNLESKTKNKNNFYKNIIDIIESYNYINSILKKIDNKYINDNKENTCSLIISRIDYFSKFLNYLDFKNCIMKLKKNTEVDKIFEDKSNSFNCIRKIEKYLFSANNILILYTICKLKVIFKESW